MIYIFQLFPIVDPIPCVPKSTGINKIDTPRSNPPLSEVNTSPSCINTLVHLLLDYIFVSPVWNEVITNIITSNPSSHMVVTFILIPKLRQNQSVRQGIGQGNWQYFRNFNHKGKQKTRCYAKSLLIFTTYKVQGWCKIIVCSLKFQPGGVNIKEILLKSTWHTHIIHSKTY